MSKKKLLVLITLTFILVALLVGCNSLNYNKVKKSIFTEGDYVCLPNENGTVTILELSQQGKEKEVLVIPETIRDMKVVSLGGRIYGGSLTEKEENRFRIFSSEKLKKLYILFDLEEQYILYSNEREYIGNIINIPNAVIVGPEGFVVKYNYDGYLCKGVALTQDRLSLYGETNEYKNGTFLSANVLYCENENDKDEILWFDYVDEEVPAGYLPDFPERNGKIVSWRAKNGEETDTWDGVVRPGLTLTACYGYSDGSFWGNYSLTDDFYVCGLVAGVTAPEKLVIPSTIDGRTVAGVEQGAFSGLPIKEVVVADTVKVIANNAFADCVNLEKITFGANCRCEELYADAFKNCTSLTTFTAPDSLRKIWGSFSGCAALVTIDVNNCTWYALSEGCTALKRFKANENNNSLFVDDGVALYMTSEYGKWLVSFASDSDVTSYVVSSDCKAVYYRAFAGNTHLENISGGMNFFQVYEGAFDGCTALKEADFNASSVSAYAFCGCSALEKIRLRGNGNVFYGPDCLKDTPETCALYVPENKIEEVENNAETIGFGGTIYSLEP